MINTVFGVKLNSRLVADHVRVHLNVPAAVLALSQQRPEERQQLSDIEVQAGQHESLFV